MKRSDLLILTAIVFIAPHAHPWVALALGALNFGVAVWHSSRGD